MYLPWRTAQIKPHSFHYTKFSNAFAKICSPRFVLFISLVSCMGDAVANSPPSVAVIPFVRNDRDEFGRDMNLGKKATSSQASRAHDLL